MYPNPQDVLPLPPRPDLDHYRKRAKELVRACSSADPAAIDAWAARWVRDLIELRPESDRAQYAREVGRYGQQVAGFARERLVPAACALAQAQYVIARAHGFASWPRLVHHLEALGARSPVSTFEAAADAIVTGDRATLERLLRRDPDLVHARSSREHRATLLHYVAANGVENYRQQTPPNIVEIARLLLDEGAEVDAGADVYGGGATALGLVLTSAHPRAAGVQLDLADLLLERGARIGPGSVRSCLTNGCPEAAGYLARRGAPLGLEEAAGIGRLDLVAHHFDGRSLADPAWRQEVGDALMMAVWYGHTDVVEFFLGRGFDPAWTVGGHGERRTALHLASYEGRVAAVALLLRHAAPVDVTDESYGTTPLVWALHAWLVEGRKDQAAYRAVVRLLAEAGAAVRAEWIDDDRVRADPELFDALMRRAAAGPETEDPADHPPPR
ncbi:MAG TPA: ankyrin repeat domain-containing protein [Longimicrobium sp.]